MSQGDRFLDSHVSQGTCPCDSFSKLEVDKAGRVISGSPDSEEEEEEHAGSNEYGLEDAAVGQDAFPDADAFFFADVGGEKDRDAQADEEEAAAAEGTCEE